ncbi:MAG: ribonuclease Z [Defluviitaleaceae bacterium]|nr:ribonuclease Z [Defluviitaleaceae bacterium]
MLDISLVGTGGMMPLPHRFLSSAILRYKTNTILIDCGEGTQVSLNILGWGFKNIDTICITHFHADHVSGLPGLLHTIANSGKTTAMTIVGPTGLETLIESLLVIARGLPFPIIYRECIGGEKIKVDEMTINTLSVDHGIACLAYCIQTHRAGKFNVEKAREMGLSPKYYSLLQKGENIVHNSRVVESAMVMGPPRQGFKIAYCTDSRPVEELVEFAGGADLFICEGIYGEDEKLPKAQEYKHMLFSEAAVLAKRAGVKELWLTHYSPALTEPSEFLHVAQAIFPNTHIGYDGKTTTLAYYDRH